MARKATIFPRKVETFKARHKNSGKKLAFKYRDEKENSLGTPIRRYLAEEEGEVSDFSTYLGTGTKA